jgi:hypothetical protein
MKSPMTHLAALLAVLGLEDLIMVPIMAEARSQPPVAAIIASGVLGTTTLASIPGQAQGRRWAFWTALACRIVDAAGVVTRRHRDRSRQARQAGELAGLTIRGFQ